MADKILQSFTLPGLNDRYTIPQVDATLTQTGRPADAKATGDQISELKSGLTSAEDFLGRIFYSLYDGYIGGNGVINPPTAPQNEKHTSLIKVTEGEKINIDFDVVTPTNNMWLQYATYNANGEFVARISIASVVRDDYKGQITIGSGVKYIRFTFRTWDGATLTLDRDGAELTEVIRSTPINGAMLDDDTVSLVKLSGDVVIDSRNLINHAWENYRYESNGSYVSNGSGILHNASVPPIIPVIGGETYTFSWGDGTFDYAYVHEFDANGNRVKYTSKGFDAHQLTITLQTTTVKVGLMTYLVTTAENWELLVPTWSQFELGDVPTQYVPHKLFNTERIDAKKLYEDMEEDVSASVEKAIVYNLPSNTVKTIAHRGDDIAAPQCTAPAYILAKKHGHTIAENDLWLSEDGQFVMWHDTTLGRLGNLVDINSYLMYTDGTDFYYVHPTTNAVYTWDGTNYVSSSVALSSLTRCAGANYGVNSEYASVGLSLNVLKRIDFGAYKSSKFKGTQILTFEEWVMLCKKLGMEIYVDKKLTYTDALLTQAANIVKKCGMGDYTSWLGLSVAQINLLRTIIPDARCGTLSHPSQNAITTYTQVNTGRGYFFNGDAKNGMTKEVIQLGLDAGFDVEVWYVDFNTTEEQTFEVFRRAIEYGVTAITTDHYRIDEAFAYLLDQY